jgi:hypothetical protein
MTKKWIAVNLGLLVIAGLLSWRLYVMVVAFRAGNDPAKIQPVRDLKLQAKLPGALAPAKPLRRYNPGEFQNIPNQNLFAESRSSQPAEEPAPVVQVVPELRAKPILVGITIAGDLRLASIIEPTVPGLPANESRRTQTRRVGDVYQGYTIVDITEDQMILENGPRREVIPLFDSTKARPQGGKTPIVATRVVNFGGGGGAAPGQRGPGVVAVGGSAQPQGGGAQASGQPATVNQVFGTAQAAPPGAQSNTARTAGQTQPGQTQQGRQTPGNTTAPAQPPPAWNERIDEQGRRVIRTPFGDIIRDKPAEKPPQ